MNIGQASATSGVSPRMIRHYESIGLMPAAPRRASGYRDYGDGDVHALRFVRRARDLGFSVDEIGQLLALWRDRNRASADVREVAALRLGELDRRIENLQAMRRTLAALVNSCQGDHRPDCPILDDLGTVA